MDVQWYPRNIKIDALLILNHTPYGRNDRGFLFNNLQKIIILTIARYL